jgi:hypothetical protein
MQGSFAEQVVAKTRSEATAEEFEIIMELYETGQIQPAIVDGELGWRSISVDGSRH